MQVLFAEIAKLEPFRRQSNAIGLRALGQRGLVALVALLARGADFYDPRSLTRGTTFESFHSANNWGLSRVDGVGSDVANPTGATRPARPCGAKREVLYPGN